MSEIWLKPLILVCVFGTVLLAVSALVRAFADSRSVGRTLSQRLKTIGQGPADAETQNPLRRHSSELPGGLPAFVERLLLKLERTLAQAQVTTSTRRLMSILLSAPVAVFLVISVLLMAAGTPLGFGRMLLVATFSFVFGAALPLMLLQAKANRQRKKLQDQFPVALDVFVRGLKAGHPIAAALDLLTTELPDPIGSQFRIVVDEVTYGAELKDALQAMGNRWDSDDIRMFVVSLSVQSETGGNLAEILENLSKVIRERQSMMLKVRALSSEGRMTAVMLSALPVLTFAILFLLNPAFYIEVAGDPWFVPGFTSMILLYMVGFLVIRRMVDLKV